MSSTQAFSEFLSHYQKTRIVSDVSSLLSWDMEVMMPTGAMEQRSSYMSYLSGHQHELVTEPKYWDLIEQLTSKGKDLSNDELLMVKLQRKRVERLKKVPQELMQELARMEVVGHESWKDARANSDFSLFKEVLRKIIDLKREYANHIAKPGENPYQVLLEDFEQDTPLEDVRRLFADFKRDFLPLLPKFLEFSKKHPPPKCDFSMSIDRQKELSHRTLELLGYDFKYGRVDVSSHPFCTGSRTDVRVTTRYKEDDWTNSLFSVLHEGGHALYELGIGKAIECNPLCNAPGMAIHESQSRFYENHIGRSLPFCEVLHKFIPKDWVRSVPTPLEIFAKVNHVSPSFIRVDADEVTYNLHILLRFEIEDQLLNRKLEVDDVKEVWNLKFKESFGLEVPTDAQGVLQDVHWSAGLFGYFPTYSLGNFASAQFYEKLVSEISFEDTIRERNFLVIREWLFRNIHQHGSRYDLLKMVKHVTQKSLSPTPFIQYLKKKFIQ